MAGLWLHTRRDGTRHLPGHPARAAARRHKAGIETWLAEQFAEHGIGAAQDLARQVMLLIEGCLSLILIHGDTSYTEAASRAGQYILQQDRHSTMQQQNT